MGAGGATYEPTRWFVTVLFLGAPPWMCMFTLEQLVRAEGYAKQSMYGLLWGVLANLVLDVLLIGVLPEYRMKGVNSLLFADLIPRYQKYGFEWGETQVEMETNSKVQSQWEWLDASIHKRRKCYIKTF